MKANVLVFPCGSEIGLEVHKSVRYSTHFELFGGSSIDDHGRFVYKNYIGGIPNVDDPDFVTKLNDIIAKYQIDFVFPTHDSVVLKLAQEKASGNLKCEVVTSPLATCEVARSKLKTYEALSGIIPTPKVFKNVDEVSESDLPVFLKPEVGQGSKGTYLASTLEELSLYLMKDPTLLILEFLPGKEFTVDCFTNKDGELLFCEGRERVRIMNGISVSSRTIEDDRFKEVANTINEKLKFRGVWFFQLKENKIGELVLMEIAPRVAGTMGLVRAKGVNLPLLSLFDASGLKVAVSENDYEMIIDRALNNRYKHNLQYSHVYMDFDDMVILEGEVNTAVIAFIYQCINKNIKVHLLTRHKEDLNETLKRLRLNGIFDEIVWLKNGENKADYIKEKDAIFIDDSFAERKPVYDALGLPVFDSHMIESLMEY